MRILWLLAAVLYAAPLAAQTRIPKPAAADSLWLVIGACSGAPILPGGDIDDVVWVVDSVAANDRFHGSRAVWSPPDTVKLDIALDYNAEPWILAHELLHHRLRGPPGPVVHPFHPFWFPCKLMPLQQPRVTP